MGSIKLNRPDPLVAVVDGPLEGRWYFATYWAWLLGHALTYPPGHPARQPSQYTPTGGMVDHPYDPDMPRAHGWRWVGR